MDGAFISENAVRYVMEFEGVPATTTQVMVVNGSDRIFNVPVTAAAAQNTDEQNQANAAQPQAAQQQTSN